MPHWHMCYQWRMFMVCLYTNKPCLIYNSKKKSRVMTKAIMIRLHSSQMNSLMFRLLPWVRPERKLTWRISYWKVSNRTKKNRNSSKQTVTKMIMQSSSLRSFPKVILSQKSLILQKMLLLRPTHLNLLIKRRFQPPLSTLMILWRQYPRKLERKE